MLPLEVFSPSIAFASSAATSLRRSASAAFFPFSASVRALSYALRLLSILPAAVEREPAQGEAPYHPPPRGQPETYAAVVALHVQVKI